jgi:hypothetical protein
VETMLLSLFPIAPRAPPCRASFAALDSYESLLLTAPLATKSLTQGLIWGAGDVVAQLQERPGALPQVRRTTNLFITGAGSGVLWSQYYDTADALLTPLPGGPVMHTVLAIGMENVLWCPLVFSLYQIPLSVLMNGGQIS